MGSERVIIEMRVPSALPGEAVLSLASQEFQVLGFEIDTEYQPVPVPPLDELKAELAAADEEIMLVRGTIEEEQKEALERESRVVAVWTDARTEAFDTEGAVPPTDISSAM